MASRNRAGVKRRIAEIADFVLADERVQVTYGWPGDSIEDSTMWFGPVEGTSTPDGFKAGETPTEDRFTIPAMLGITPFLDAAEAEEGVERVLRIFDDALSRCKRLKDTLAVIPDGDDPTTYDGIRSVYIAQAQGPYTPLATTTENSPIVGLYGLTIECVSDLR
jgi:hypothetical protein